MWWLRGSQWTSWLLVGLGVLVLGATFARSLRFGAIDLQVYQAASVAVTTHGRLYEGALRWRDQGIGPYQWERVEEVQQPYIYPPLFAIAVAPLFVLPFETAKVVWLSLNVASLLGAVALLLNVLRPLPVSRLLTCTIVVTGLLVATRPVRVAFAVGQVDVMLTFLVVLALAAFVRHRDARAGVALGLAIAVKPFLGLLALFWLWKGAWRAAMVSWALAVVLIVGPLFVLGFGTTVDWMNAMAYVSSPAYATSPANQSPSGFLLRSFTANPFTESIIDAPVLVPVLRAALIVGVMAVLVRLVSRSRALAPPTLALEFGLAVVAMLLVSPQAQTNHFVILLVPLMVVGTILAREQPTRPVRLLALGVGCVAAYFVVLNEGWQLSELHLVGLCAAAVVTVLAVQWCRGRPRAGPAAAAVSCQGRRHRAPEWARRG